MLRVRGIWQNYFHFIPKIKQKAITVDEIIEVLNRYLLDENLRKQKEKIGLEWSKNYTQEHYAKRLLKNIYDFLGKDINLDFNIQSLWIGDKLSNMEILSMKSFLHNNHNYHLYTSDKSHQ